MRAVLWAVNSGTVIIKRMNEAVITRPLVILSCAVFRHLLEPLFPPETVKAIGFFDYGLHQQPKHLRLTLQRAIDDLQQPSIVLLGYGLCGNGLHGVMAKQHYLVVPRAHDCITILLGSPDAYQQLVKEERGTYFLSKGWLESGSNPLMEYRNLLEKYDVPTAQWIMDQQYRHYRRLVFVAHSQADLEAYRSQAREVAQFCAQWGMTYEERLGSLAYVEKFIEAVQALQSSEWFLVVPPGGSIRQSDFISVS